MPPKRTIPLKCPHCDAPPFEGEHARQSLRRHEKRCPHNAERATDSAAVAANVARFGEESVSELLRLLPASVVEELATQPEHCVTTYMPALMWCNGDLPRNNIFTTRNSRVYMGDAPVSPAALLATSFRHSHELAKVALKECRFKTPAAIGVAWSEYGHAISDGKAIRPSQSWPGIAYVPEDAAGDNVIDPVAMTRDLTAAIQEAIAAALHSGRYQTTQQIVDDAGIYGVIARHIDSVVCGPCCVTHLVPGDVPNADA